MVQMLVLFLVRLVENFLMLMLLEFFMIILY